MSVDGNKEMMGRLVRRRRHEQFLREEVQRAASTRRPCSRALDSFALVRRARFRGYSVLAPYSTRRPQAQVVFEPFSSLNDCTAQSRERRSR